MDSKLLLEQIQEIEDIGIDVSYIIKVAKDACNNNEIFEIETIMQLAFEKQEQMLEKICDINMKIFSQTLAES